MELATGKKPKTEKFVKFFIVLDDVTMNDEKHFQILIRIYRHINCTIICSGQDLIVASKRSTRGLYNCY